MTRTASQEARSSLAVLEVLIRMQIGSRAGAAIVFQVSGEVPRHREGGE